MMNLRPLAAMWSQSGANPEYLALLSDLLNPPAAAEANSPGAAEGNAARFARLPALCCAAFGGDPAHTTEATAAWALLYQAAHLMDHVADGDPLTGPLSAATPGQAINAASGLYFSASLLLNELYHLPHTCRAAPGIARDFYLGFLNMCGGQHLDLTLARPTLEQYWEIAGGKSGAFFRLACRLGARLADPALERLEALGEFGQALGMLVQVLDDLEDYRDVAQTGRWPEMHKTLPVVYARYVLPEAGRQELDRRLEAAPQDPAAGQAAQAILEQSGAALYLLGEFHRWRAAALTALDQAEPLPGPRQALTALLPSVEGLG